LTLQFLSDIFVVYRYYLPKYQVCCFNDVLKKFTNKLIIYFFKFIVTNNNGIITKRHK